MSTPDLDNDIASIRFCEKLVGQIELSARHNDPRNPDFTNTQPAQVDQYVDLSPEYQIGQSVTINELRLEFPDVKITEEMQNTSYYRMANGNIRENNGDKPVISPDEVNKIYSKVIVKTKKSAIRDRLEQSKGFKGERPIAKMERLAREKIAGTREMVNND